MTDPKNSNDDQQRPSTGDSDDAWKEFEQGHADDLDDIARSREAKRFERQAKRKERLLSVNDLDQGTFTDDTGEDHSGPRDFTQSSWLDTDDIMDRIGGDDFVPPNPVIGRIPVTKLVFWALFVTGILGVILSVFIPALTGILGTVFGVCALLGGAGLIVGRRGHTRENADIIDDGSRV